MSADPYDLVRYPPTVHPQTHPDRLFVNATLLGLRPAPVDRCRVLELGCGDGSNLAAVAFLHEGSECVGVDLSAAAIADGQTFAAALGLKNLSLRAMDVTDIGTGYGQFDYVIAHGLYSWVPPAVQEKVLSICAANLAPGGVAYVSYAVHPGAHFRQMLQGMMRYHVRQFPDPTDQVKQAKGLLHFLAQAQPQPGAPAPADERPAQAYSRQRGENFAGVIRNELDHMARMPPALVFHDDLAPFNSALHFHEFAALAARHELQYLADAEFAETQPPVPGAPSSLSPEVKRVLDQLPPNDVVAREQYYDFVRCRQFRQSLMCHASVTLTRPAASQNVRTLFAASAARPVADNDPASTAPQQFQLPGKGFITVSHPIGKAALAELGAAWPAHVHHDDLLRRCRARLGAPPVGDDAADARVVADVLLSGYAANVIGLHAHAPSFASKAGERPVASALARMQARQGNQVTNLLGNTLALGGPGAPRFLQLLDGTRDLDALARAFAELCRAEGIPIDDAGRQVTDAKDLIHVLRRDLDRKLNDLARLGLLIE